MANTPFEDMEAIKRFLEHYKATERLQKTKEFMEENVKNLKDLLRIL